MKAINRSTLAALISACALSVLIVGCAVEQSAGPSIDAPLFQIWDGAHLGNPDFFFLPPTVPDPSAYDEFDAEGFDASRSPTVEICAVLGDACDATQPTGFPVLYSMSTGPGSETVRLVEADQHYVVNWHTNEFALDDQTTYRIRVLVAGTELGFADVDAVSSGKELKNVDTGEYIALKDGRTLPIKFRIEYGAVHVVGSEGGTVSALDGDVTLVVPADALTGEIGITVQPAVGYPDDPDIVPGSVHDFGPDGTEFATPVDLTIQYHPDSVLAGSGESDLVLVHLTGEARTEVPGSSVDAATHTVTGPVSSFSVYGVALQSSVPVPVFSTPLIFQSNRDGDHEIFSFDGTNLTQLTSNEVDDGAPDWRGDKIVYQSMETGDYDIWAMDDVGGSPVNLTNRTDADEYGGWLSPDGTKIAFVRWPHGPVPEEFDIWVMNMDGTGQVNLTADSPGHDGAVSWSPDGSRIAFQSKRDGNMEVYVMNSDGSGVTRLTYDEAYSDAGPEWSPDGSQIVFAKYKPGVEGEIWIMEADGSAAQSITTSDGTLDASPSWSPDGSQIAFVRYSSLPSGPSDIWLTTPDGSTPVAIVTDAAYDLAPSWKREAVPIVLVSVEQQVTATDDAETNPRLGADRQGEIVVFTDYTVVDGEYGLGNIHYQRLNADGTLNGSSEPISGGGTDDKFNDVSGNLIVYTAYESTSLLLGRLMLYEIDTGYTTELISAVDTPREVRIEGDAVVWTQGQTGSTRVHYLDLGWSSGNPIELGGSAPAANVEIGERFVVWEEFRNGQRDIFAYDLLMAMPVAVSDDASLDERLPSTSGTWVVWQALGPDGWTIQGRNVATDATFVIENGAVVRRPSIYGNLVAFESDVEGHYEVYLYWIAKGETFRVTTDTHDQFLNNLYGNQVAYTDMRTGSLDIFVSTFELVPEW